MIVEGNSSERDRIPSRVWWIIALCALVHTLLAVSIPLTADETYYWEWSRKLDFGYFDQGPLIAWALRLTCSVFGDTVIGIRSVAILCFAVFQIFGYRLAALFFDSKIPLWSIVIIALTPLGVAGGFMATYDALLIACWSVASYQVAKLLFFGSRSAWIWVGIALGIGLLAKLTMILFVLCVFLFLLIQSDFRKWIWSWRLWAALGIGLLLVSPYIWWLSTHDWITFAHLGRLSNRIDSTPAILKPLAFALVQSGLVSPVLFVLAILGSIRLWKGGQNLSATHGRFILSLGAPVLIFFLLLSFKGKIGENWPGIGWLIIGLPVAQFAMPDGIESRKNKMRQLWFKVGVGISCAMVFVLVVPMAVSSLLPVLGNRLPPFLLVNFRKILGGAELGKSAAQAMKEMEQKSGGPVLLAGTTYQETSRLSFFVKDQPHAICLFLMSRSNQYQFWNPASESLKGKNLLVVLQDGPDSERISKLKNYFKRIEVSNAKLGVGKLDTNPEGVDRYYFYECYGFIPNQSEELLTAPTTH